MGTDIQSGTTFIDGNLYHDADFNAAINNATLLPTAISARSLKSDMSLGDEILVNDSGTLRKITGQQIIKIAVLPAGCMMDYAGTTEPLGWVFCYGQDMSTTTYAALFAAIGYTYGGSGATFKVPDCRGRVTAGDDNMGGTAANRITTAGSGMDGKVLGIAGGAESLIITTAQMPAHTHVTTDHIHTGVTNHLHLVPNHQHLLPGPVPEYTGTDRGGSGTFGLNPSGRYTDASTGAVWSGAADRALSTGVADRVLTTTSVGGGTAINNVQPTIVMNKIIKT
jgi:microcystin-dependent protein